MAYVMLKDINFGLQNRTVKARVVRFSDYMSMYEPNKRSKIEMVLVDEEGNIMEGQVPEYWHKRSRIKLEEDRVYVIKYFEVGKAKKSFRAGPRDCMIEFTPHTIIQEPTCIPNNFPLYGHLVASFDELRTRIGNDLVTSDTVVVLTGCSHPRDQNTAAAGVKRLRNLTVTDGTDSISVALWGKHADEFNAEACMLDSTQKPVVLLLCGMTCRKFNNKLSLSNSGIFRYYINPEMQEAHALRESCMNAVPPLGWLDAPARPIEPETWTVAAIAALARPHELENKRVQLTAKIKELEPSQPWWYLACNRCRKSMRGEDGAFKCNDYDCTSTEGTARYRVPLRVVDPHVSLSDKDAPTIQVVFFGPTAEEILGTTVHNLINSDMEPGRVIPKRIEDLYGKIIAVRVGVNSYSFKSFGMCVQVNSLISVSPAIDEPQGQPSQSQPTEEASTAETPTGTIVSEKGHAVTQHAEDKEIEHGKHPAATDPQQQTEELSADKSKEVEGSVEDHPTAKKETATPPPLRPKRSLAEKSTKEPNKSRRTDSTARRKLNLNESENEE